MIMAMVRGNKLPSRLCLVFLCNGQMRIPADVVTFNTLLSICIRGNRFEESLNLMEQMTAKNIDPDPVTIVGCLTACESSTAHRRLRLSLSLSLYIHTYKCIKGESFCCCCCCCC